MKALITFATGLGIVLCGTLHAITLVPSKNVKIVIFAPESHADVVREAMATNGAGKIGNYDSCSFSIKGIGRWRALEGANPVIGQIGVLEMGSEERVEAICPIDCLEDMIAAVKRVHPYEEVGYDIYPLLDIQK